MSVKISTGNTKMGKVYNISLPPIKSCDSNSPCFKSCYAIKSYRMFKYTKIAWDCNFELVMNDRDRYFNYIEEYLSKIKKPSLFRWHVAGDILDQEYFNSMNLIANKFSNWKFLAFTKKHDLKYDNLVNNLNIVFSMWPGWGEINNDFPRAWMQDGTENRIIGKSYECNGNCEKCQICWHLKEKENVIFIKH